ncbi:hypothetical protein RXV91_04325 [Lactiplantibacillus sp. DA1]|uniref:hypothetical protein n=1 Tax=Lactiplantibacillus sp. DA1 TaxID=3079857 RepID=UPI00292A5F4A|nr:hypothetical protein [Lactiplantibacillus sp. DA1]MDV0430110.1 hypothetical protein [Lactiplantibacillus sp. DA1]
MAVKLSTITHGQGGWDDVEKLNQDTGLVPLTMIGAIEGLYQAEVAPYARRVNGIVHLTSGIVAKADIPASTKIVDLPDKFLGADGGITALCRNVSDQSEFPVTAKDDGLYVAKSLPSGTKLDFAGLTYLGKDV